MLRIVLVVGVTMALLAGTACQTSTTTAPVSTSANTSSGMSEQPSAGPSASTSTNTATAASVQVKNGGYTKITSEQGKKLLDSDKSILLVDVRTPEEYAEKHIGGSILLPLDSLEALAATELPDKDTKIIIYCRSGRRSAEAAQKLVAMGYTGIYDMGGIQSWPYDTETGEYKRNKN